MVTNPNVGRSKRSFTGELAVVDEHIKHVDVSPVVYRFENCFEKIAFYLFYCRKFFVLFKYHLQLNINTLYMFQ